MINDDIYSYDCDSDHSTFHSYAVVNENDIIVAIIKDFVTNDIKNGLNIIDTNLRYNKFSKYGVDYN